MYASTDAGLANQIELLPAWVEEFNSTNGGRNGRAQLGTHADPGGGPDQLRYVNVVFGPGRGDERDGAPAAAT